MRRLLLALRPRFVAAAVAAKATSGHRHVTLAARPAGSPAASVRILRPRGAIPAVPLVARDAAIGGARRRAR